MWTFGDNGTRGSDCLKNCFICNSLHLQHVFKRHRIAWYTFTFVLFHESPNVKWEHITFLLFYCLSYMIVFNEVNTYSSDNKIYNCIFDKFWTLNNFDNLFISLKLPILWQDWIKQENVIKSLQQNNKNHEN